ncbi:hypothetical protein BGZ73_008445 [Actinomortierella ambigua]|nr:hypothetical protein BGZ73_008445 [Actinomortierella ambigua]
MNSSVHHSSLHQTPLAVPELRLLVCSFLDYNDIKSCAVVCRAWHRDLQPLVWRHLTVNVSKHHKTSALKKTARMDSIRANARWIRDFRHVLALGSIIIPELYDILFDRCRSLLTFEAKILYDDEWLVLKKLIQLNTGLTQIDLLFSASPWLLVADLQLPTILRAHPYLRNFRTNYSMTASMLLGILRACPSLEEVEVHIELSPPWLVDPDTAGDDGKKIKDEDTETLGCLTTTSTATIVSAAVMDTTRLRRLKLGGACDDPSLGIVLERSPMLEHLQLVPLPASVLFCVYRALQGRMPTRLTSLVTETKQNRPSPLGVLVQALPRHQLCNIDASPLEASEIRKLVELHHESIEHVRLHIAPDAQEAIVDFLTQCRRLKTLVVTTTDFAIDVHNLIGRNPWVCLELEVLHLPIGMPQSCRGRPMTWSTSTEEDEVELSRPSKSPLVPILLESSSAHSCCRHQQDWKQTQIAFTRNLGHLRKLRGLDLDLGRRGRTTAVKEILPLTLSWSHDLMRLARLLQTEYPDGGDCQLYVQGNIPTPLGV